MGESEHQREKINHIQTEEILNMILTELTKNLDNANTGSTGSDFQKTKNDWVSCAAFHLFEHSSKSDRKVSFEEFRVSLIKAAAVIVAALEYSFNHDLIKEYNLDIESFIKNIENTK